MVVGSVTKRKQQCEPVSHLPLVSCLLMSYEQTRRSEPCTSVFFLAVPAIRSRKERVVGHISLAVLPANEIIQDSFAVLVSTVRYEIWTILMRSPN